jgi:hypothetical protein
VARIKLVWLQKRSEGSFCEIDWVSYYGLL